MCHLDTGQLQRAHRMWKSVTGKRVGVTGMRIEQMTGNQWANPPIIYQP